MRRREFVNLLGGAAAAWPVRARGQVAAKVARIGYLAASSPDRSRRVLAAFHQRLRELGLVDGRDVRIEYRFANGAHGQLPRLAAELVASKVDLIVAAPTTAVLAARTATTTIPIVMIAATDPVGFGWIDSLARPGGNLTGITFTVGVETFTKELELLKEVAPDVRLVAVLSNPTNPSHPAVIERIESAARLSGLRLQLLEARGPEAFDGVFAAIASERAGALLVVADEAYLDEAPALAGWAVENKLPTISQLRLPVEGGLLMAYGPNAADLWLRAAEYVDKVLSGVSPADLPVQQPTTFELIVNLKTAKALGLTLAPTLLARADEVIE